MMKISRWISFERRMAIGTKKTDGCWFWINSVDTSGYGLIRRNGIRVKAHRAAWEMENGPIPKNMKACHKCDVPSCVRPEHIFIGTQSENVKDSVLKGRKNAPTGSNNGNSKLNSDDVSEIRSLAVSGCSQREIGSRFEISHTQVGNILRREQWSSVA